MMDLSLATTEQIFLELSKRYNGLLLVHESKTQGQEDHFDFGFLYHGGISLGIGLARRAMSELLDSEGTEWVEHDDGN